MFIMSLPRSLGSPNFLKTGKESMNQNGSHDFVFSYKFPSLEYEVVVGTQRKEWDLPTFFQFRISHRNHKHGDIISVSSLSQSNLPPLPVQGERKVKAVMTRFFTFTAFVPSAQNGRQSVNTRAPSRRQSTLLY